MDRGFATPCGMLARTKSQSMPRAEFPPRNTGWLGLSLRHAHQAVNLPPIGGSQTNSPTRRMVTFASTDADMAAAALVRVCVGVSAADRSRRVGVRMQAPCNTAVTVPLRPSVGQCWGTPEVWPDCSDTPGDCLSGSQDCDRTPGFVEEERPCLAEAPPLGACALRRRATGSLAAAEGRAVPGRPCGRGARPSASICGAGRVLARAGAGLRARALGRDVAREAHEVRAGLGAALRAARPSHGSGRCSAGSTSGGA